MRCVQRACLPLLLLLWMAPALSDCELQSTVRRVPVLELYTSEGCSSCPPADAWLARLHPDTAAVVPLALHVDYWDRLGWKDRFSRPEFSARQRAIAARSRSATVYTPQFILDGVDWRGWWTRQSLDDALAPKAGIAPLATIAGTGRFDGALVDVSATIRLHDAAADRTSVAYVALVEHGLHTAVRAGENRGRTLRHDHVVQLLHGPVALDRTNLRVHARLQPRSGTVPERLGIVVFIQDVDTGITLQSAWANACL